MRERCLSPGHKQYKNYGGRGITICSEWDDFEKFKTWSLMNGYKEGLEIGRIDIDGPYEPSNCRYATPEVQCNNRQTSRVETYMGVTDSLINLCRIFNKNYNSVRGKVTKGASIESAMGTTVKPFVIPDHANPAKKKPSAKARAAAQASA